VIFKVAADIRGVANLEAESGVPEIKKKKKRKKI